ncbi:Cdc6/Cdc18 family protein [Natronocalculus amylovorans]|uniref:AAA family ATPase n=1 Tax=Natronocalculus amylovorans TaxID=2917812 RepID=A0AAE3FYD3_9EURY|nr:AAA family ATPase [Natronocalculus amylovorans]MCL9817658.1 AAA family ATPase [Natronocalculus amylovorans]
MNIDERIARRRQTSSQPQLVLDYEPLSPLFHPREPIGRGSLLEQLLDQLEPALLGRHPSDLYVWGPKGSGKTAVVKALFRAFNRTIKPETEPIHTTTRVDSVSVFDFVYIDARTAKTRFALYRAILDRLIDESVPTQGVGTAWVQEKLEAALAPTKNGVVVAVDHVGEPETQSILQLQEILQPLQSDLSVVLIGAETPESAGVDGESVINTIECTPYQTHDLVEILTGRLSDSLVRNAVSHDQLREVAEWADGDVHDALSALFTAVIEAEQTDSDYITDNQLQTGFKSVPRPCVPLGRVLALPKSQLLVLNQLTQLPEQALTSVGRATESIAKRDIDLSEGTIKRLIYELSESGITERIPTERDVQVGRSPSRIELRFPYKLLSHREFGSK